MERLISTSMQILEELKNEAASIQSDFQRALIRECKNHHATPTGAFPRIRNGESCVFYIYWDKFVMQDGKLIRRSKSIPMNKSSEFPYSAKIFKGAGTPNWELVTIMEFEHRFSLIRQKVRAISKIIQLVKKT